MLTLYRSNRAEFLATLLARQLLEERPDPFETVEVLVNTWPTSRWLGEQLATANGISSLVRFPFPGSRLRQLVRRVLDLPDQEQDPWRATSLVWAVLEQMPALLEQPVARPLRVWLQQRDGGDASGLSRDRWRGWPGSWRRLCIANRSACRCSPLWSGCGPVPWTPRCCQR